MSVTLTAGQTLANQTLQLLPGATIKGIITNPATQTPLNGIAVFLAEPNGTTQSTVTDSTGAYQFAALGIGSYTVSLSPGTGSPQKVSVATSNLNGTALTANLQFNPASQLSGTLADSSGNPVAGGTVSLYQNGIFVGSTTSANDGTFSLLITSGGTFDIQPSAPGMTFSPAKGIVVAKGSNVVAGFKAGSNTLSVKITNGSASVTGTVVNLFQSTEGGWLYVTSATVASTGQASFPGLVPGTYRVVAQPGRTIPGAVQSITITKSTSATVALAQQGTLSGTVTDSSSNPIAGASVELDSQSNATPPILRDDHL